MKRLVLAAAILLPLAFAAGAATRTAERPGRDTSGTRSARPSAACPWAAGAREGCPRPREGRCPGLEGRAGRPAAHGLPAAGGGVV